MSAPHRVLARDPQTFAYVRAVRLTHRGFQTHGRTSLDAVRAQKRNQSVHDLISLLDTAGPAFASPGPGPHPNGRDFRSARSDLRATYPRDRSLRTDLRNARYNPDGPVPHTVVQQELIAAITAFRRSMQHSSTLGRREKKRERARAWAALHANLSGINLALLAVAHPTVDPLSTVARGAMR